MHFSSAPYGSKQWAEEHAEWFKYLNDWSRCDFYKYNPLDGTSFMNYSTYREGRENGTIPAPNPVEVLFDTIKPIHVQQKDGV